MATRLQIMIAGSPLDLYVDEEERFYITKLIHDLRNLETRNGDFSKSLTIPLTPNNRTLLAEQIPTAIRDSDEAVSNIECEVLISGVPVLPDSYIAVLNQRPKEGELDVQIIGGSSLFFNQLSTEFIGALDWSDLDMEWTLDGIQAINGNATGIVFARSEWYTNKSRRLYIEAGGLDVDTGLNDTELGESGFWVYCKEVLDRIFATFDNLTVDQSLMDDLYSRLAFPVSVPVIHDSFGDENGFYAEVRDTDPFQSLPSDVMTQFRYLTIFSDDDNLWTPYQFTLAEAGFLTIYAGGLIKVAGGNSLYFASVRRNGIEIAVELVSCPNPSTYYGFNVQTTSSGVIGDVYDIAITPYGGEGTPLFSSGSFSIENQGSGRGRTINIGSLLPEISQREFVREIFKVQSIVPTEESKVVTFHYFEEIRNAVPIENINLDVSRSISLFASLASYGQRNQMKYADNEEVERKDTDSEFLVNSVTLQKSVVKVELLFSACDVAEISFGQSGRGSTVPNYSLNWEFINDNKISVQGGSPNYTTTERNDIKAGDFIGIPNAGRRRVLAVISDFEGVTDLPFSATQNDFDWNFWSYDKIDLELHLNALFTTTGESMIVRDGGSSQSYSNVVVSDFNFEMKFGGAEGLSATYYDLIIKSMDKPFIVQAWSVIGVVQFIELTGLQPL